MVYSTQQAILYDILNNHCHPQRKMQHLHFMAHKLLLDCKQRIIMHTGKCQMDKVQWSYFNDSM